MKILLTNDDGYGSAGIQTLFELLEGKHEVVMIAPHIDRSAISHAITMNDPIEFIKKEKNMYTCSGTPVDCVAAGIMSIFNGEKPDLVLSGINCGGNLGTDIVFSGTVAAARQAVMHAIPGIAVSLMQSDNGDYNFDALANFVLQNLDTLAKMSYFDVLVNINAKSAPSYSHASFASISRRIFKSKGEIITHAEGKKQFLYGGGTIETENDGTSDWDIVMNGGISVSQVYAQPVLDKKTSESPIFKF
ncbi:5'/3'-nucleotidase SurE [Treponema phagedenis]|uniref:5'-nucleotidase SurE n=1 Tax=Treponema phagedenis TaxID=162 RepID=A0A0B7GWE1_TREPH|nr:5'/3'-nucleotidase SurE [Treponema phagedenis]EFW36938.1 SurE-like protein [Treponema phagedenis F0421]NVP23457.1 5'/3'-nucleotidase SurE [Treponema phagedenis]QEJ95155.1 5'/3'-nucleotidase SurE [Treponema phagedenis]QEJ98601.1 5'/3'-nucleotidase SurE [Treponema phagedenis]QEK01080.1 5'/3'-nucleotidase SurE [Treponema phagedenis]